ncbi:hypothetical protein S83_025971 [Arachis hypogaea]|nr:uncharacterized protein DS421_8g240220 [Arachis hypogaea]
MLLHQSKYIFITCSGFLGEELIHTYTHTMSSSARNWIVAASVGVVEAMKDQGVCRWNYALRNVQQHVKSHVRSFSQPKQQFSSSSSAAMVSTTTVLKRSQKAKQSEESLRTVMYLSCWGPN